MVITAHNTNVGNPRLLRVTPRCLDEAPGDAWEFTPFANGNHENSSVTNFWSAASKFDRFRIEVVGGAGNVYIKSIELNGVDFVASPTGVCVVPGSCRAQISWTNPSNAVQNRVVVYEVIQREESYRLYRSYDFNEFSNAGSTTKNVTTDFIAAYPDFSGREIRTPAFSTGKIQISGSHTENRGYLVHNGFNSYGDLTIFLSAKRFDYPEEARIMTVDYVDETVSPPLTNRICDLALDVEFSNFVIPLSVVKPEKAFILFNAGGKDSNHRVIVDEMSFVKDYTPQSTQTNVVAEAFVCAKKSCRVSPLTADSDYFAVVYAYDGNGKCSAASERIKFTTKRADGFSILLR
jgi:hypothetical protein